MWCQCACTNVASHIYEDVQFQNIILHIDKYIYSFRTSYGHLCSACMPHIRNWTLIIALVHAWRKVPNWYANKNSYCNFLYLGRKINIWRWGWRNQSVKPIWEYFIFCKVFFLAECGDVKKQGEGGWRRQAFSTSGKDDIWNWWLHNHFDETPFK